MLADSTAAPGKLLIPEVRQTSLRAITVEDYAALRSVDALSVSPDGQRFAVFVRQGDPVANDFRAGWFVGSTAGGALTFVGDGGHVRPSVSRSGHRVGQFTGRESRWSPDGQWIAYAREQDGEVQLWRSRVDGSVQEQVTHNAADVREFAWSDDGRRLFFTAGTPRAEIQARELARDFRGYGFDDDISYVNDLMSPRLPRALDTDPPEWTVTLDQRLEQLADDAEREAFARTQARVAGGRDSFRGYAQDAAIPPIARADGTLAWLVRTAPASIMLRVVASLPGNPEPTRCEAEQCAGFIQKVWWSEDGSRVLFWRREGVSHGTYTFYSWSPAAGTISTILRAPDDDIRLCTESAADRLICARETKTRPPHIAAIDFRSGTIQVLADLNPELRNIRLGKVERYEWETPTYSWSEPGGRLAGIYPKRAYGYILYPPQFDARKQYPVFIAPYVASGFLAFDVEHALHAYAANGFVVLNLGFPLPLDIASRLGPGSQQQLYAADLDFPHLTLLMESTARGLDVAAGKGFVDTRRVGIGGISHGTFVPLYMMQKQDRIAAISISSATWGPHEYYMSTRKGRRATTEIHGKNGYEDWRQRPEGAGRTFWSRFDIADHVDELEAPILMHPPDSEVHALLRLIRHLDDADRPYDAYVFPNEAHVKWQPAHLHAIMNRNLDWFRFWLQDIEDPEPAKAGQYERWRQLRELQCRNPRSLRDYCNVVSTRAPIAH